MVIIMFLTKLEDKTVNKQFKLVDYMHNIKVVLADYCMITILNKGNCGWHNINLRAFYIIINFNNTMPCPCWIYFAAKFVCYDMKIYKMNFEYLNSFLKHMLPFLAKFLAVKLLYRSDIDICVYIQRPYDKCPLISTFPFFATFPFLLKNLVPCLTSHL